MITIRRAELADAGTILRWRNDPATREASAGTNEVAWDEHIAWFSRIVESDDHRLYIAREDDLPGGPVGMVRFDLAGDRQSAVVSINLDPERRGRGLGLPVLLAGIGAVEGEFDLGLTLGAMIRSSNFASIRIFEAAGFRSLNGDGDLRSFARGAS